MLLISPLAAGAADNDQLPAGAAPMIARLHLPEVSCPSSCPPPPRPLPVSAPEQKGQPRRSRSQRGGTYVR